MMDKDGEVQILEDSNIHSSSSSWSHHQRSDQNQSPQPQQGFSDKLSMSFKVINDELIGRNRELERRLRLVELQVTACLEGQSMLTQVLHKCDMLELRLKTMKEEIQEMNGRLKEFENELRSPDPVHPNTLLSSKLEMPDNQHQGSGQDSSGRNPDFEETDTDYLNPEPEGQDGQGHDKSWKYMDPYLFTCEFKPYQCKLCGPEPTAFTKHEDFEEHYMSQHRLPNLGLDKELSLFNRRRKPRMVSDRHYIQPTIEENHNTHLSDKENSTPNQSNLNQRKPTDKDDHRDEGSQPNVGHKCSDYGRMVTRSHHIRSLRRCSRSLRRLIEKDKLMLNQTTKTRTIPTRGQKSDLACSKGCGPTFRSALASADEGSASAASTEVTVLNLLKPKPYSCKECGYEYKFRNRLQRHFNKVHREIRPVSSTFGRDMSPLHIKKKHLYQQPAASRRKGGGQKWR